MGDVSLVSYESSKVAVKDGVINSTLNDDVLIKILKDHVASDHVGYHALKPYLDVCRLFRNTLLKCALSAVSLDEPLYINRTNPANAKKLLEENKRIYGAFVSMLEERAGINVQSLSICTVHTDRELVEKHYEILRRCAGSLTDLHLNLQEQYEKKELGSILSRLNLRSIIFYEHVFPIDQVNLKWSIVNVFLTVQGCTSLRTLFIPDICRDSPEEDIPDGFDLELPIEILHTDNLYWSPQDLNLLRMVKLPRLKEFKGSMLVDWDDNRAVFRHCLTHNWVKTLINLDLSVSEFSRRRIDSRHDIFDVANDMLPKLKKLSISAELLRPRSLFAFPTLEHVHYTNASLSDLEELATSLRDSTVDSNVLLPSLQTLELYDFAFELSALPYIDCICFALKKRGVRLEVGPRRLSEELLKRGFRSKPQSLVKTSATRMSRICRRLNRELGQFTQLQYEN